MPGSFFQLLARSLTTLSGLACHFVRFLMLVSRSRRALAAENLFVRKQLALFQERKLKPQRAHDFTRLVSAVHFMFPIFVPSLFHLGANRNSFSFNAVPTVPSVPSVPSYWKICIDIGHVKHYVHMGRTRNMEHWELEESLDKD